MTCLGVKGKGVAKLPQHLAHPLHPLLHPPQLLPLPRRQPHKHAPVKALLDPPNHPPQQRGLRDPSVGRAEAGDGEERARVVEVQ